MAATEESAMFGAATGRWLKGIGVAAVAVAGILAAALGTGPAKAEVDLSIAMPGIGYYTPPPTYHYGYRYWDYPVVGGIYLGFGHYHHHYW
jgi:hypothetical protein